MLAFSRSSRVTPTSKGEQICSVASSVWVFLIVALIAGLFGFGVVSAESWAVANIFFFIFLVLAVLAFVGGFIFTRKGTA